MSDEDYKDLVTTHDKSIGIMAASIDHLATAVGTTNNKLEDIVNVIGQQNVLMEKFSNLESNLKESFDRVHSKTSALERANKLIAEETKKIISPGIIKWILGIVVVYTVTFGTYIVSELHRLDNVTAMHFAEDKYAHSVFTDKVQQLSDFTNRNYGFIQSHIDKKDK